MQATEMPWENGYDRPFSQGIVLVMLYVFVVLFF